MDDVMIEIGVKHFWAETSTYFQGLADVNSSLGKAPSWPHFRTLNYLYFPSRAGGRMLLGYQTFWSIRSKS